MRHYTLAIVVAAGLLVPATTNVLGQPTAPDNRVTVKEFLDIPGTAVGDLTGNVKFPNSPDLSFFPGYFEWPQSSPPDINVPPPADYKNNYGTQIQGYFFPPTTGAYIFRLCADDNAQLWLSTDSNPANKVLIATEPQWNNPRDYLGTERRPNAENVAVPITLQANQPYYIEALMKEGGGGDNLSVAVEGGAIDPNLPIPGQYLAMYREATGAPVIFSVQPESVLAVVGGQPVTMTVATDGPWAIQWVKTLNGVTTDIAGATSAIYTYTPVAADNGATIAARVTNDAGSTTSRAIPLEVDPDAPAQLVRGFLRVEHYGDIAGTAVLPFYSDPRYATRDYDFLTYAFGADVPQTSPNLDNFARIVSGWVQPPTTGQWRFFIRSDDGSELHVDADVTHPNMIDDPHNRLPVAEELAFGAPFQPPGDARTTEPFQLNAANRYALVALYKEGGGGDLMQIAWREEGDTTAPAQLQPIAPGFVYTMASPAGQRAEITTQPMSQTAEAGKRVEFTVSATTRPTAGLFAVQWTRDGVEIPGATGPTYRTPVLTVADNGAVFAAKVFTLTGELTSQNATLTVLDDITPPVPTAGALVSRDGTTVDIGVGFDEPVSDATASVQANYSVSVGTITSFSYQPKSQAALIKVTGLAPGDGGVVTVRNVADVAGNAIPAAGAQAPFRVSQNLTWNVVGGAEGPGGIAGNYVVPLGDGAFDVFSNGVTQWATYDESTFVYEEITGDFDKRVRVEYQDNSSQWARAGIIVREVTNFGVDREAQTDGGQAGRYQKVHVNPQGPTLTGPCTDGNNMWEGNRRIAVGGATDSAGGGGTPQYPNAWCRIQREGSTVTIYRSDDGLAWTQLGQTVFDPPLPALVYVGPDYSPEIGNITNEADRGTFLAKFRNYSNTFAEGAPGLSAAVQPNGDIVITFEGTLQERDATGGAWNVTTLASPATITPAGAGKLYRAVQ